MALMKELERRLDDNSEPLAKRIKLGKNALLSSEFYLQKKEDTIISWFCSKLNTSEDIENVVSTLIDCCSSEHFIQLNTNEIREDTKKLIVKVLTEQLENNNSELNDVLTLSIIICESPVFFQHLKHNITDYVLIINEILKRINDRKQLNQILENFYHIYKNVEDKSPALNLIISNTLPILSEIYGKFSDTPRFVDFTHQVLFPNSLRHLYKNAIEQLFETSITEKPKASTPLLSDFIIKFRSIYSHLEINDLKNLLNIYFGAFIKCFKNDEKTVFQLFVIFAKLLGFESEIKFSKSLKSVKKFSIEKSIALLNILLSNLNEVTDFDTVFLDKIKFSGYLKSVIHNTMKMAKNSSECIYQVFQTLIRLNPNLAEGMSSDILIYSMLNHKNQNQIVEYSKFMIALFNMFAKLHREQKLISLILKSTGTILSEEELELVFSIDDVTIDDCLPQEVISHLSEVMSNFPGKTFIALFRAFIFQLKNDIIANIDSCINDKKFNILLQIQTILINTFMLSATIADDLKSDAMFTKFLDNMKEYKSLLKEFGLKILHLEHENIDPGQIAKYAKISIIFNKLYFQHCELMTSFLKLCYVWGELYIFLCHFKSSEENLKIYLSSDIQNENYLHNYLSGDQWNTIEQRIANFGEPQCKQHLKKIFYQISRLTILCEQKTADPNLLKLFSFNNINLQTTKDVTDVKLLAKEIVNTSIQNEDLEIIQSEYVQENMSLILSIVEICLKKMNKELKATTKAHSDTELNFQSQNCIKEIEINDIKSENFSEDTSNFQSVLNENRTSDRVDIEMRNVVNLLNVLEQLPLAYCSEKLRVEMILLSMCLHNDCFDKNAHVTNLAEKIIELIIKINFPSKIFNILTLDQIIKHIIDYKNFQTLLKVIVGYVVKHENLITNLKSVLKYCRSLDTLKQSSISYTIFRIIVDAKKTHLSIETKKMIRSFTYKLSITVSEALSKDLLTNGTVKIGLYGLAIDRCLITDKKNILNNLLIYFDDVLSFCLLDSVPEKNDFRITDEDKAEFLNIVVKNKKRLDTNLPKDFLCRCGLLNMENSLFNFSALLSHSQPEELQILIDNLLDKTKVYLKTNSINKLKRIVEVWEVLVEHKFNVVKSRIRQNALQIILREFLYLLKNGPENVQISTIMLKNIHKLLQTQVPLTPTMLDLILEILYEVNHSKDFSQHNIEEFESVFSVSMSILDVLFTFRSVLIIDRIQSALVPYRLLLKKLCMRGQVQPDINEEIAIARCAHNFQRTNENLTKHKKDVARIAPYLIADTLQYYEKITFYPMVKNYLNSCLYALLNLCDSHAVSFLLRNLSIPSKEIFKIVHDDFNKYYRFTGKS